MKSPISNQRATIGSINSDLFGHGTGTGSAIGSVSGGGNVHSSNIEAGVAVTSAQTQDINAVLGSVAIVGDASAVTVEAGTVVGTASKINSVKIGGSAYAVSVTSDWIVAVSVDGLTAPLTAGSHNDNDVSFGDVLCTEV
jgi:hypothetical protein